MEPATRSFDSSFAPIPRSDDRFARQDRYGPPPEFPLASPCPGIVHHLSGPIARALAPPPRQSGRDGPVVLAAPPPRGSAETARAPRRAPLLPARGGGFFAAPRSPARALASLVRVSRRV